MAGFARKKYFKLAKGFMGAPKNCFRSCVIKVEKSLVKAYCGRKKRPRILKRGWISSINAGTRDLGLNYSLFIYGLNNSNIKLNRKILADLVINEPYSFKAVFDQIQVQSELLDRPNGSKRFTIEEMIRRNLLTAAKLQKDDFTPKDPEGIQLRFTN